MQLPTIHLNGSSPDRLIEEWDAAYQAIGDAITALAQCAPNGRDYYPLGIAAYRTAENEHRARLTALHGIRDDLQAFCDAAWEAKHAQERQRNP